MHLLNLQTKPMIKAVETRAERVIAERIAAFEQLDSMQQLPVSELRLLAEYAVLRTFESHAIIAAEQTIGQHLFLILSGNIEQTMRDADGTEITLALLGRGDLFGEGGLFGLRYRRITARATSRSYVLQFRYTDIQNNKTTLSQFLALLHHRFRERLLHTTLARVPLLASLNPIERLSLSEHLEAMQVGKGETILQAGNPSQGLYIIAEGQATVVDQEHTIAVLEPGDVFGETFLFNDAQHMSAVVAFTAVHLLFLPQHAFRQLQARQSPIAERIRMLAQQRQQTNPDSEQIRITEQLVQSGLVRGRLALARETTLCAPDCHRCEDACGARFGKSRLDFGGLSFGKYETADTCRQCRWSAECVEACPEDAFRLNRDGYLVVTDRCIGCGACVTACQYSAINQVPFYAPTSSLLDWVLRHVTSQPPTLMRANKCDACDGHEDQACISACPTGALQWIPVEVLAQSKAWQPIELQVAS